jgi:hypothetical protein
MRDADAIARRGAKGRAPAPLLTLARVGAVEASTRTIGTQSQRPADSHVANLHGVLLDSTESP